MKRVANVLVVGDVHGEFHLLRRMLAKLDRTPDLILQVGDFGYWPDSGFLVEGPDGRNAVWSLAALDGLPPIRFCDGNHENHWRLRDRASDEVAPGVVYQPRGSTLTLPDGRVVLFMGGAASIDAAYRKVGVDWFPEEAINYADMERLPDTKVDIVVSHTCPSSWQEVLVRRSPYRNSGFTDASEVALDLVLERYRPTQWFHGHWHAYERGRHVPTGTGWTSLGPIEARRPVAWSCAWLD